MPDSISGGTIIGLAANMESALAFKEHSNYVAYFGAVINMRALGIWNSL